MEDHHRQSRATFDARVWGDLAELNELAHGRVDLPKGEQAGRWARVIRPSGPMTAWHYVTEPRGYRLACDGFAMMPLARAIAFHGQLTIDWSEVRPLMGMCAACAARAG